MRAINVALIAGPLLVWSIDAKADATAGDLAKACAEYPSQSDGSALCMGYVSGTIDAYRVLNRGVLNGRLFCETATFSQDVIMQTVKNYLLKHPEKSSKQAASVLLDMLTEVLPCK
jgi:hypothetical protein